ncbi:MAG TPA: hypothetical protein VGO00_19335, partial [Kofleriaceae bacterium]|nr:hypothetical protein [Kofleriaceae bacterium]
VCGIDGESTFGIVRREAIARPRDEAIDEALANLATEQVTEETVRFGDLDVIVVGGSFYAAEKLLDVAFMGALQQRLGTPSVAAATPARGMLLVMAFDHSAGRLARFTALARMQFDDAGGRAISPAVMLVNEGRVYGIGRRDADPVEPASRRADTAPGSPKLGLLRRLFGRK